MAGSSTPHAGWPATSRAERRAADDLLKVS
jgi:hypothetical protein